MTTTSRIGIPHLPALDGLRGLAVLGVLAFHDDRLRGGYLGVDLFFVLSGFLITSLLLAEWNATQRIDLAAFWLRRARRLFPALLALVPAVALYAVVLAEATELRRIRWDGFATLAYVANWRAIFNGADYWALFSAPSPFEHTWSLAIEEQFYVFWPILVALVLRVSPPQRKGLLGLCVALALASAGAMGLMASPERLSRVYMGTDTRGTSILLGAALACVLTGFPQFSARRVRQLDVAGLVALLVLSAAWLRLDGQSLWLYRGGFWATELCVLVLILCATQVRTSQLAKLFSVAPLRWAGLISYGLYLWHWPLYVILSERRLGFGGWKLSALRLTATLLVSVVSFIYYERPIRRHGLRFGKPGWVVAGVTALAAASLWLGTRGALAAPPALNFKASRVELPPPQLLPADALRVMVVGDSVALSLGERMHFVEHDGKAAVATRAVGDCSLFEGVAPTMSLSKRPHQGGNCSASWGQDAAELRPEFAFVVLGGGFFAKAKLAGRWQHTCEPAWQKAYAQELTTKLAALSRSAHRVAIAKVPYPAGNWRIGNWDGKVDCFNSMLTAIAKRQNLPMVDLMGYLCPGGTCSLKSREALIRPDGMHFQGLGAEDSARWLLSQLHELRRKSDASQ